MLSTRDLGSGFYVDRESGSKDHFASESTRPRSGSELHAVLRDSAWNPCSLAVQCASSACRVELTPAHIESGSGIWIQWIRFQCLCGEPLWCSSYFIQNMIYWAKNCVLPLVTFMNILFFQFSVVFCVTSRITQQVKINTELKDNQKHLQNIVFIVEAVCEKLLQEFLFWVGPVNKNMNIFKGIGNRIKINFFKRQ